MLKGNRKDIFFTLNCSWNGCLQTLKDKTKKQEISDKGGIDYLRNKSLRTRNDKASNLLLGEHNDYSLE